MSLKRIKISNSIFHQRGGADVRRERVHPSLLGEGVRYHQSKEDEQRYPFYKQEDIDAVRLIYHLVKERGMTLAGARQKLKDNKETTIRQEEIVNRLKQIKEELLAMKDAFDAFAPKV